jgi:hypothetical protein
MGMMPVHNLTSGVGAAQANGGSLQLPRQGIAQPPGEFWVGGPA